MKSTMKSTMELTAKLSKRKKIPHQPPEKIIKRVLAELNGFDLLGALGLEKPDIAKILEKWEVVCFNHAFVQCLFGKNYPTGNVEEWKWCPKCQKMIIYKQSKYDKWQLSDFNYCPKCGAKAEYKAQVELYPDVYLYRLVDMVRLPDRDSRLQYIWQMLDYKKENEKLYQKVVEQVEKLKKLNKVK